MEGGPTAFHDAPAAARVATGEFRRPSQSDLHGRVRSPPLAVTPRNTDEPVLRVVTPDGHDIARWSLGEIERPDLAAAESIARLQASVRPNGWLVVVERPCRRLRLALGLIGLGDVIEPADP